MTAGRASFQVSELGRYRYTIHAWVDHWETWRRDLLKRIQADNDTTVDYHIGANLVEEAAARTKGSDAGWLAEKTRSLRTETDAKCAARRPWIAH